MPGPPRSDDFARLAELIGQKVRAGRLRLDLSQEELGHRAGMDRKSIQNIEYGRSSTKGADGHYGPGNPKLDAIWAIANVLDLELAYLVDPTRPVEPASGER